MLRALLLACLFVPAPALALDGPSYDCAKAEGAAEKPVCADADLARLDRAVSARFAQAMATARGLDAGATEAENTLRAMQRGWIKGRDDCWKAQDLRDCVAFSYRRREAELVAEWMLEPVAETLFWTCGGTPANEVVTMFFDTELPSLRFERGDSIDTGTRVPSASGARYEGSFGRAILIEGDAATYTDPDGTTYTCTRR